MSDRDPKTGRFPPRPENPGKGAGYGGDGGPAKGAARLVPGARTRETIAAKAERANRLIERLEELAFTAQRESDQIAAAQGALKHLAPSADAHLAADTATAISRKPVSEDEWEREHGAAGMGASARPAARAN